MRLGEGLPNVFARHQGLAEACRSAVQGSPLPIEYAESAVRSPVLTGVVTPIGIDADQRKLIYAQFNMSRGTGLGKPEGRMLRIGHPGDCNELILMAALSSCEMRLRLAACAPHGFP